MINNYFTSISSLKSNYTKFLFPGQLRRRENHQEPRFPTSAENRRPERRARYIVRQHRAGGRANFANTELIVRRRGPR